MTNPPTSYAAIFGRSLRAARLRAGLRQADMAELAGIRLQEILLLEAGIFAVTIQTMGAVAEAVGCPLPIITFSARWQVVVFRYRNA